MSVEAPSEPSAVVFETAAEHVATRVPVAAPSDRVEEIRRSLEGRHFQTAQAVA